MSEHRSPHRSDLFAGYCPSWPKCECARCLDHDELYSVVERMGDERFPTPTPDEVEELETKVFMTLSCVSANCPVPRLRHQAIIELMKPWYDRQRRRGHALS